MQFLGFLGIVLIFGGVVLILVLTASKDDKDLESSTPTVCAFNEPDCVNYLSSTEIGDDFKMVCSDTCEGDTFVIKSMTSATFETTEMEGLRPVYSSELQGDASDTTSVIYALNKYLKSAEDLSFRGIISFRTIFAVMNGKVTSNSAGEPWQVADYSC